MKLRSLWQLRCGTHHGFAEYMPVGDLKALIIRTISYRHKSINLIKTNLEQSEHTITITHTGEDGTELGIAYFAVDEQ